MKQNIKYTAEKLEIIANYLKAMPPVEKKMQEFSKQEAVKILTKEIAALQKRGYSLAQISDALKGQGLEIATPTLKSYLQRAKPKAKTAKNESSTGTNKTGQNSNENKESLATNETQKATNASFTPKPDTDDI